MLGLQPRFQNRPHALEDGASVGTLFRYVNSPQSYLCPGRIPGGEGISPGPGYSNGHFDYTAVGFFRGSRLSSIPTTADYVFLPSNTTVTGLPTPFYVEETSYYVNKNNIDGSWGNDDEHSNHHQGVVLRFGGRQRALVPGPQEAAAQGPAAARSGRSPPVVCGGAQGPLERPRAEE